MFSVVQIKLFDLRLVQKGAIQSYAGHVNSHNNLPLVVDPSETLLMSGKFILGSRHRCGCFCHILLRRMSFEVTH